jgi:hypothetical protein
MKWNKYAQVIKPLTRGPIATLTKTNELKWENVIKISAALSIFWMI